MNHGYQEKEVRDEEVWPQVRHEEEGRSEEGGQEAQVVASTLCIVEREAGEVRRPFLHL
jgi:hypothetical protein